MLYKFFSLTTQIQVYRLTDYKYLYGRYYGMSQKGELQNSDCSKQQNQKKQ